MGYAKAGTERPRFCVLPNFRLVRAGCLQRGFRRARGDTATILVFRNSDLVKLAQRNQGVESSRVVMSQTEPSIAQSPNGSARGIRSPPEVEGATVPEAVGGSGSGLRPAGFHRSPATHSYGWLMLLN